MFTRVELCNQERLAVWPYLLQFFWYARKSAENMIRELPAVHFHSGVLKWLRKVFSQHWTNGISQSSLHWVLVLF